MNWDKEAKSWAVAHGMGSLALGPVEATKRQTAVMHAAKWQRDQLRTNEAIERVARALNGAGWVCMGCEYEPYDFDQCGSCRDVCLKQARAVIAALLGDN